MRLNSRPSRSHYYTPVTKNRPAALRKMTEFKGWPLSRVKLVGDNYVTYAECALPIFHQYDV